ncbi:hypothetical protein FRB94_000325 [Tulasnella sp. JGI-2019a]|nr:hypothetical protein FRB94_000325 [Tulasnella sp. JGI-2019a]
MSASNIPVTVQRMQLGPDSPTSDTDSTNWTLELSPFYEPSLRTVPIVGDETTGSNTQSPIPVGFVEASTPTSSGLFIDDEDGDPHAAARDEFIRLRDELMAQVLPEEPIQEGPSPERADTSGDLLSRNIASASLGEERPETIDTDYTFAVQLAEEERQFIINEEVARYWMGAPEPVDYSLTFDDLVDRGYIEEAVLDRIAQLSHNMDQTAPRKLDSATTSTPPIFNDPSLPNPFDTDHNIINVHRADNGIDPMPTAEAQGDVSTQPAASSKGKQRAVVTVTDLPEEIERPRASTSVDLADNLDHPRRQLLDDDDDDDDDESDITEIEEIPFSLASQKGKARETVINSVERSLGESLEDAITSVMLTSATPQVDRSCGICWEVCHGLDTNEDTTSRPSRETKPGLEMACSGGHFYCVPCIREYIQTKLGEIPASGSVGQTGTFAIKCPECPRLDDSFGGWMIGDEVAEMALDRDTLDTWRMRKFLASMSQFYCPNPSCSIVMEVPELDNVTMAECPMCHIGMCFQCRTAWHSGLTCEEYKALKAATPEDRMVDELAKANQWRRCPNCKMVVERNQGCLHMVCRCGAQFCHRCGSKWVSRCVANCREWKDESILAVAEGSGSQAVDDFDWAQWAD